MINYEWLHWTATGNGHYRVTTDTWYADVLLEYATRWQAVILTTNSTYPDTDLEDVIVNAICNE